MITPDDMCDEYGADTFRVYEMSMGPLDASRPWETRAVVGSYRFLQRVWRTVVDEDDGRDARRLDDAGDDATRRLLHRTIDGVAQRLRAPAVQHGRGEADRAEQPPDPARPVVPREAVEALVLMLAPLAPHVAEELWSRLGHHESLARGPFPVADPGAAGRGHGDLRRPGRRQGARPDRGAGRHRRGRRCASWRWPRPACSARWTAERCVRSWSAHRASSTSCRPDGRRGSSRRRYPGPSGRRWPWSPTRRPISSPELVGDLQIAVVPLRVVIGGVQYLEGEEVGAEDVTEAIADKVTVTTSRPSPQAFLAMYARLAEAGFTRGRVGPPVRRGVRDVRLGRARRARSRRCPWRSSTRARWRSGLGFARPRRRSGRRSRRQPLSRSRARRVRSPAASRSLFYVDTLEYLRRGGRISAARAMLGSALAVKPILHVIDGRIDLLEKVRTSARGPGPARRSRGRGGR